MLSSSPGPPKSCTAPPPPPAAHYPPHTAPQTAATPAPRPPRHIQVVQHIRRPHIHRQRLLMLRLRIARQRERPLHIHVQVKRPRHHALVARKHSRPARTPPAARTASASHPACPGRRILRTIVEVAIAVVIEPRRDVVVRIAAAIEVACSAATFSGRFNVALPKRFHTFCPVRCANSPTFEYELCGVKNSLSSVSSTRSTRTAADRRTARASTCAAPSPQTPR